MKDSKKIALMGLLLALVFVLSLVENSLPPIPFVPPNVKLGLANVAGMYCIFFVGKKEAVFLTVSKSLFVFITRGFVASVLSLTGGLLSVAVIIIAWKLSKNSLSYVTYSILGAIFHNIGQIIAFSLLMRNWYMFYYLPALLVFGVIMGTVTGSLLKSIMPYFKNILQCEYYE
jgi:heptaprenyl diphosphate synthase